MIKVIAVFQGMRKHRFLALLLWNVLSFMSALSIADDMALKFADKPPEGFEELTAPQSTVVDIYFGGKKITETMVTFSPDQFIFTNPQELIKTIPRLKETEHNTIVTALKTNLAQNTQLICQRPNQPTNCGTLKPDIAGIIFDEGHFKVDLFINPSLLDIVNLIDNPYLPFPETEEWGYIKNLSGGFSGVGSKLSYNLRVTDIISYYLTRLRLSTYTNNTGLYVDNATLETEWRDWEASAGMFRTRSIDLLGQSEVLGLRVATSFKQRIDLRTAYGNQVVVFLSQRALIKVFRDSQLIASQIYEAGNQTIDSSNFPDGVYNIDIVIEEAGGNTRVEHFFFAKSITIPPLGHPFYTAEIGVRKKLNQQTVLIPQYTTAPIIHLGTAWRLTDFLGIDSDVLYSNNEYYASFGSSVIYEFLSLRVGGLASNTGYGTELRGSLQLDQFNLVFNAQKSWQDATVKSNTLSLSSFNQADIGSGYSFDNGISFNVRGQWRQNNAANNIQSSQFNITPSLRTPLFNYQGFRADLNASYTITSTDKLALLTISLQQSTPIGLNFSNQTQAEYRPSDAEPVLFNNLHADWQSDPNDINDNLRGSIEWRTKQNNHAIRLTGDYRTNSMGVSGFAEQTLLNQGDNSIAYGGQIITNVIGDKEGISIGSADFRESAIIIDLRGSPKGAAFDVLVSRLARNPTSENKIADAYVGAENIISLEPYESYDIRIVPQKTTFADYDNKIYTTTLYPASIERLVWKVQQVITLISLITYPDGSLVSNARVEGATEPAITDDQGLLQVDVGTDSALIFKKKDKPTCQVTLPEKLEPKNGIVILDKLICSSL